MRGYIYVLSNPAFPGLLKIGRTADAPDARMRQLNTTGVPNLFMLEASFLVANAKEVETQIHELLADIRHTENREFFRTSTRFILEKIHPIILRNVDGEFSGEVAKEKTKLSLSAAEIDVLQILVAAGSSYGLGIYDIKHHHSDDALSLEISLSHLHATKLVSRRVRGSDYSGPTWTATPKGIKLLADNGLIDEWMRKYRGT